jgi:CheY-like chemotaxis protein
MPEIVPGTARILVVDDDQITVEVTAAVLERDGNVVSKAYDGLQALAEIEAERPDLVLLNVYMPGIDGYETCRRIRADPATTHLPVIMVTGNGDREKSLEAGANDFFRKPVNLMALRARVRELLGQNHESILEQVRAIRRALPSSTEPIDHKALDSLRQLERERPNIVREEEAINLFFKAAADLLKDLEEAAANSNAALLHRASVMLGSWSERMRAVVLSLRCRELEVMAQSGVVSDAVPMVGAILEDYRAVEIALSARLPKVV